MKIYLNKDSGNVTFCCSEMGILNIDLNNINFNNNFDHPNTIILIRRFTWHIKFEKRKALKKNQGRINANNVASYKMVEFLYVRR